MSNQLLFLIFVENAKKVETLSSSLARSIFNKYWNIIVGQIPIGADLNVSLTFFHFVNVSLKKSAICLFIFLR